MTTEGPVQGDAVMARPSVGDVLERVLSTFVQVFLAGVLASSAVVSGAGRVPWVNIALIALFAALVSLVTSGLKLAAGLVFTNPYVDLGYRTAMTFAQTLLGIMVTAGAVSALDFDWTSALKLALVAAGTALLKGMIGIARPETEGASVFGTTLVSSRTVDRR